MTDLGDKVLSAIEKRGLSPRPYGYFLAKRSIYWSLAGVSILLGAVSIAVAIFAVEDFIRTGGRNFIDMPFDDVFANLPFAWLAAFLLFIASAWLGISRTKRGYRYRPFGVVVAVLAASVALGLVFHALDIGRRIHGALSAQFPTYRQYTHVPYAEWTRPDLGYLGGEVLSEVEGVSLRLRDFQGRAWEVDISSAAIADGVMRPLAEEGDVAIRGERTGDATFKAISIDEFD